MGGVLVTMYPLLSFFSNGGFMKVLIVQSCTQLGMLWKNHLTRQGMEVFLAPGQSQAIKVLIQHSPEIIVLDLMLDQGSAFAVSDFANYRCPEAQVIFVTNTSFFSDGSIFSHSSNACAFIQSETPPEDLALLIEHFGTRGSQTPA